VDHTLATALIDAEGRVVELWRGNGWTVEEVLGVLRSRSRAD
jgi:protein SCO1/2